MVLLHVTLLGIVESAYWQFAPRIPNTEPYSTPHAK